MSLRSRITAHLERVIEFNIQEVITPLLKKAGTLPVAGIVLFTATASMNAAAANTLPSPFSKGSSSSEQRNHSSSASNSSSISVTAADIASSTRNELSDREIKRLNSKGLDVADARCASATYKMFINGQNARKYSIREKIVAANFVQSFLKNDDLDLLSQYAVAIEKADLAYRYDWNQMQSSANQYARSVSSSRYESSVEDKVEHKVNQGAKAIFDAIGFRETSEDLDKKIQRYEEKQARAENYEKSRELKEKDKRISKMLETVELEMKNPSRSLDFTTNEARQANQGFYNELMDLLQPEDVDVSAAHAACESQVDLKGP